MGSCRRRHRAVMAVGLMLALVLCVEAGRPGRRAEAQGEEIFVPNWASSSITVYSRTASGNAVPVRTIAGPATGLSTPLRVSVDPVHGEVVVTNGSAVLIFSQTASGNTPPLRTLAGPATGLGFPRGVLIDILHDEILVVDPPTTSVRVFARTATGDVAPLRTLAGGLTGLSNPWGLALDVWNDEVLVANQAGGSVTAYARTADGNAAPLRTLLGGLGSPSAVAVDGVNREMAVMDGGCACLRVFALGASGGATPLRSLGGPATGMSAPRDVAVDTVNDEILVVNSTSDAITVYARTATGNVAPLRTIAGASTGLDEPPGLAFAAPPTTLVAAVLPASRSVQVGALATAFATIINAGTATAYEVGIARRTALPGAFGFQRTNPLTNAVEGTANAAVNIPPGQAQTFVIGTAPSARFGPADVQLDFAGTNVVPPPPLVGINTLLLSASAEPVPDIVALAATLGNDGIVNIPGAAGVGVFSVATVNVGAGASITAVADTGGVTVPVTVTLCETHPATGDCLALPAGSVTRTINPGETPTFGVFVAGSGVVGFDPAVNRIFVRLQQAGVTRGATSVAARTQ